MLFYRGEL
jgi:hypothetical protein